MIRYLKNDAEVLQVFSINEYRLIMQTLVEHISEYQKTNSTEIGAKGRYAAMQSIELDDKTFKYMWVEAFWEKINDISFVVALDNMIVGDKEEDLMNDQVLDRYNELKKEMEEETKNPLDNVN